MEEPTRDELIFEVFCNKPRWDEGYINSLTDEQLREIAKEWRE